MDAPDSPRTDHPADHATDLAALTATLTRSLAGFGAASVLAGALMAALSQNATTRAFGRQSAAWGAINVGVAGVGAWRSRTRPPEAARLRRTLLVNSALDAGYVAAGAHMAHHATTFGGRTTPEAARGHGAAVALQGVGLLALDLGFAVRVGMRTPRF